MAPAAKPKFLCCNCAQRPVVANHRCNACRLYYWRTGFDRDVTLTDRQRDRVLIS